MMVEMEKDILDKIEKVREFIVNEMLLGLLFSGDDGKIRHSKACVCLDTFDSTQAAINKFYSVTDTSMEYDIKCLYIYGLLQSFYMQQDAMSDFMQSIQLGKIKWNDPEFNKIKEVRRLRNDVCHPTSDKYVKSFHFLSVSRENSLSLKIGSYSSKDNYNFNFRNVCLKEMRDDQEHVIALMLDKVLNCFKKKILEHKLKFKNMRKMVDVIKGRYSDELGKLYDEFDPNNETLTTYMKSNLDSLKMVIDEVKEGLSIRHKMKCLKHDIEKAEYIIEKLYGYFSNGSSCQMDIEIYADCLRMIFGEIESILPDIDEEFDTNNTDE